MSPPVVGAFQETATLPAALEVAFSDPTLPGLAAVVTVVVVTE